MPTYEFRCPEGHQTDRFYKTISTAPAEIPCPECGKVASRQLSGGAGLHFKGSGFYLTDYGKNAHRKAETGKSEGGKSDTGKSEAGKAEPAKAESAKAESAKAESQKPKAESQKPKAESAPKSPSPKPKSE